MEVLGDHDSEAEMRRRHPDWNGHHVLERSHIRLLAYLQKFAYGYVVAEWGLTGFPMSADHRSKLFEVNRKRPSQPG
jgi:hypothetical protein